MIDKNPEKYLWKIQDMLKNETYDVSEYTTSIINDKGKERVLMKLPYYPDRIIQWAILLQTEDIFMKSFCNHTCASISGRGIHYAVRLMNKYLKDEEGTKYCLKIDIKKYYPNVNHEILKQLLRKKFKDIKLLNLFDKIIDSHPDDKGIPIGSYLSQYLANFYLTYFDHWLKEDMKEKYVIRYMDDVVILSNSKEHLHNLFYKMKEYLEINLKLEIKGNWQIFPVESRGIDFVGYRHFHKYKLLRKNTCKRFKKKMIYIKKKKDGCKNLTYSEWCSVNSYKGWLDFCNSYRLSTKYLEPIKHYADKYYSDFIKGGSVSQ